MRWFLAASFLTFLVAGLGKVAFTEEPSKSEAAVDITEKVRQINSEKYASPPTEFRRGKVSPRNLEADSIKSEGTGFRIQLPSQAPIPAPTVYEGRLYVSGGFH